MSFEVRAYYPAEEWSGERDDEIFLAAGEGKFKWCSEWSGMGFGKRDLGWTVPDFAEAVRLKSLIEGCVEGCGVREATTHDSSTEPPQ